MRSIELFAGAGGLALGVAKAGFSHEAVLEYDSDACNALILNQKRKVFPKTRHELTPVDVHKFDYAVIEETVDVITGGPPCQPFSIGGKHKGHRDERNLFPEAVRAVRELQPRAFIFENVRGLVRESFAKYFEYIVLQLTYPELERKSDEAWEQHLARLERHHTGGRYRAPFYRVVYRVLQAADYGVPQRRERVFIIGFRSDISSDGWSFPEPTHTRDRLLYDQWQTGEYWDRHKVAKRLRPDRPPQVSWLFPPPTKPWRTVRDAISNLPDPLHQPDVIYNHVFIAGARVYAGHTGSPFDEPAKTLKAGDHGVPGGENMLAHRDGSVRYFTVRESARLQTFPDEYIFCSSWTESMRQLGNAVPVELASAVALSVAKHLRRIDSNGRQDKIRGNI